MLNNLGVRLVEHVKDKDGCQKCLLFHRCAILMWAQSQLLQSIPMGKHSRSTSTLAAKPRVKSRYLGSPYCLD